MLGYSPSNLRSQLESWLPVDRPVHHRQRAWERVFPASGRNGEYLVTVILNSDSHDTRIVYASCSADGDPRPRVPWKVRESAEAFKQNLLTNL